MNDLLQLNDLPHGIDNCGSGLPMPPSHTHKYPNTGQPMPTKSAASTTTPKCDGTMILPRLMCKRPLSASDPAYAGSDAATNRSGSSASLQSAASSVSSATAAASTSVPLSAATCSKRAKGHNCTADAGINMPQPQCRNVYYSNGLPQQQQKQQQRQLHQPQSNLQQAPQNPEQPTPQLLQQLMASTPATPASTRQSAATKLLANGVSRVYGGRCNEAQQQKQQQQQQLPPASNSVLKNLLVSGCDISAGYACAVPAPLRAKKASLKA